MITVLTGENDYTVAEAVSDIIASFDGEVERYDGHDLEANDLPDICTGATLFSSQRLVIIREAATNKLLYSELGQWIERVPDSTHIVFVDTNPDKRTKTYKQLQKHATIRQHNATNEADLVSWLGGIMREHQMDTPPDTLRYLVQYTGHDQWRLRSELEKLLLADRPITPQLIRDIAEPYPEASVFELLDSVFTGNTDRVAELVGSLREREDPYMFFGLLSSQVSALLALVVAGSRQPDEVARDMGLHPFVVRKLSPLAQRLGRARIRVLVEKLAHCDSRIKTSGVDPWDQIARTLLSITI